MLDYYCGDKMKRIRNKNIDRSLKIIKKERERIKEEKQKIKLEKEQKFYSTKFGCFLMDFFDINIQEKSVTKIIRKRILSSIISVLFGGILCLMVLFILTGGRNYLKLYKELNDFIDTYDTVTNEYYGELSKEKMIDSVIESLITSVGDVYTTYSDEESTTSFLEDLKGTYEGIGCLVSMNEENDIYVVDVFDGTPAFKAGILKDDIILEIDGIDYRDKTSEDMSSYVKNDAKEKVTLKIKRNDKELDINLVRDKVEIPSAVGEVIEQNNKKIGYISIDVFSSVTDVQFEKELKKLEKKEIEGLIIDVRNNTGGYLDVVTDISSLFLTKGKVIYQLETDDKKEKIKDNTKENRKYPIVVLTNGGSASASEILTASIKESYDNGFVVGTDTFGKGTVQKTKTLKNGNMIKYTIQKWLTPKGKYIDENGIKPTDVVEFDTTGFREDSQLDYSIKLLEKLIK